MSRVCVILLKSYNIHVSAHASMLRHMAAVRDFYSKFGVWINHWDNIGHKII